jgi:hypothetical protein
VLVLLALLGLALTLWGLVACAPPPLPGDELWTWRQNIGAALGLVLRAGTTTCFTGDPAGGVALALGTRSAAILLVVLAVIVLWELVGRELRRAWFRGRGGHLLLAGVPDDVAGLALVHRAPTAYLAPDRAAATDFARHHPFRETIAIDGPRLPQQLERHGAPAAKLLAAVTRNDLTNVALAEAALAHPGRAEILLRLEQSSVRALSSHRLRQRAEKQGRDLAIVSRTALQTRRGMAAAMSGRYTLDDNPRVHIAIAGTGEGLQAVAMEVVRQGFGLDTDKPLISILRTGMADFAAGALERLESNEAAEVQVTTAIAAAAGSLDRAITGLVLDAPPLRAVHCLGATPEEAEAIALEWEEVLLALHQSVPPIVAYGATDRPLGVSGMIRVALAPDLAEARDLARLMDARAVAVHAEFMRAQREARGDKFGSAPAEAEWAHLPEPFRDDNRNVADQMDFKLASIFMRAVPGKDNAPIGPDDAEALARLAHARWWASKALSGWRFGKDRDDRAQLHPDMQPYDLLSEPVKQKDRDEVASLPRLAELAGEALRHERRVAVPHLLDTAALDVLEASLRATPKESVPVAVLPLEQAPMIDIAASLLADGIAIEAVLGGGTDYAMPGLADVLRRAWRVHVATGDVREALTARAREAADNRGTIHALA